MNTRDLKLNEPMFTLFKGDPKTGKSIAAHSYELTPSDLYPDGLKDTYTLSFDRRMQSVKAFYPNKDFEYDYFPDLINVNNRLRELKEMPQGRIPFAAVIFDGITRYSDLAVNCMIEHRAPTIDSKSKTVRAGIPMAEIEDYGGEARALTMVLDDLLAINIKHKIHVIVIAHVIETQSTDIKTKSIKVTRQLVTAGKKIAAKLPVDFNEVYHFYAESDFATDESNFYAITRTNSLDWAATCMPLPQKLNWTNKNFYEEVQKYIVGSEFF